MSLPPAVIAERGLSAHILPTSATMIGVCMTVLSIGHFLRQGGGHSGVVIDKLLAFDALLFLSSAVLSFMSIRSRRGGAHHERRAEVVFLFGLAVLAIGAVVLAFVIN